MRRLWLLIAALVAGCTALPQPGLVMRKGASNGPAYEERVAVLLKYGYDYLKIGDEPIRDDGTSHPIVGGEPGAWITQGRVNLRPDAWPLTRENYSGVVAAGPGLDWRGIGGE